MHPLVRQGLAFLRELGVRAGRAGGTAIAESAAADLEKALRKGANRVRQVRAEWQAMMREEKDDEGRDD